MTVKEKCVDIAHRLDTGDVDVARREADFIKVHGGEIWNLRAHVIAMNKKNALLAQQQATADTSEPEPAAKPDLDPDTDNTGDDDNDDETRCCSCRCPECEEGQCGSCSNSDCDDTECLHDAESTRRREDEDEGDD